MKPTYPQIFTNFVLVTLQLSNANCMGDSLGRYLFLALHIPRKSHDVKNDRSPSPNASDDHGSLFFSLPRRMLCFEINIPFTFSPDDSQIYFPSDVSVRLLDSKPPTIFLLYFPTDWPQGERLA